MKSNSRFNRDQSDLQGDTVNGLTQHDKMLSHFDSVFLVQFMQ